MVFKVQGVVWISGFSRSGKTTIGNLVTGKLKEQGFPAVFLDDEDLRSIFDAGWGYERQGRIETAKTYARLADHLAEQGHAVVLSSGLMYDEVRSVASDSGRWVQVYLNVPEPVRISRGASAQNTPEFDAFGEETVELDNYGEDFDPGAVSDLVIELYIARRLSENHPS